MRLGHVSTLLDNLFMDYQGIRNKIDDGKKIVEKYKHQTPKPVLEVCYSMLDINSLLVDKLEELDNKISKNSKSSSKPPSTDNKDEVKKNQSLRGKSGKKSGGQKGRVGSTLKRVATPDDIIDHKLQGKCSCGQKHCSEYPVGVTANIQYGQSVRAVVSYLSKYQLVPYDRLSELMSDVFEVKVSEGSIDNFANYSENSLSACL